MSVTPMTRRQFGQAGVAAAALIGHAASVRAAAAGGAVRLGAPVPSPSDDPEELALAHRKLGYRAAYCPPVELNDKERIPLKGHFVRLLENFVDRECPVG